MQSVDSSAFVSEQETETSSDDAAFALTVRARDAHKAVQAAAANTLALALDAGDILLELQQELKKEGIGWEFLAAKVALSPAKHG
jgi:hypothetical protein